MAYQNRNFSYGGGSAPYRNAAPYNPNYGFNNNRPNQVANRPRKRSGCKRTDKDGTVILSGWKASRQGLLSVYARPYSGTKEHVGAQRGKHYLNYFVTIVNKNTGHETKTSGLFCMETGKLHIPQLNWVMNPSAPNGGYCGKSISKQYNR